MALSSPSSGVPSSNKACVKRLVLICVTVSIASLGWPAGSCGWTHMSCVEFANRAYTQQPHCRLSLFCKNYQAMSAHRNVEHEGGWSCSLSKARDTPASPPTAKPYSAARPIPTPLAPRASALTTSVPRRIPPSTNTSSLLNTCGQCSLISRSTWTGVVVVSSALPP